MCMHGLGYTSKAAPCCARANRPRQQQQPLTLCATGKQAPAAPRPLCCAWRAAHGSPAGSRQLRARLTRGLVAQTLHMQVRGAGPLPAARLLRLHLRQLRHDAVHDVGERLALLLPGRSRAASGGSARGCQPPQPGSCCC